MDPVEPKCLVSQLKGLRSRDTSFTDYQLYFQDGICGSSAAREDPRENDPLYSCFTKDKVFDPNTGLPARMRKWQSKPDHDDDEPAEYRGVSDDEGIGEENEMPEGCEFVPAPAAAAVPSKLAGPVTIEEDLEPENSLPDQPPKAHTTIMIGNTQEVVIPQPAPVPAAAPAKRRPSQQRPWTAHPGQTKNKLTPLERPGHLWKAPQARGVTRPRSAVVRSGGWQNINHE